MNGRFCAIIAKSCFTEDSVHGETGSAIFAELIEVGLEIVGPRMIPSQTCLIAQASSVADSLPHRFEIYVIRPAVKEQCQI